MLMINLSRKRIGDLLTNCNNSDPLHALGLGSMAFLKGKIQI